MSRASQRANEDSGQWPYLPLETHTEVTHTPQIQIVFIQAFVSIYFKNLFSGKKTYSKGQTGNNGGGGAEGRS